MMTLNPLHLDTSLGKYMIVLPVVSPAPCGKDGSAGIIYRSLHLGKILPAPLRALGLYSADNNFGHWTRSQASDFIYFKF